MNESSRVLLRRFFLGGYSDLKARLTRQLGSADLANDALQDTWLKLETATPVSPILHPHSYLFRIAFNIALKRKRAERRAISLGEAREALEVPVDQPSPEAVVEGHSELQVLKVALAELTERQLQILLAYRLEGVSLADLAKHLGLSKRSIARDLRFAVLHCSKRLNKKID